MRDTSVTKSGPNLLSFAFSLIGPVVAVICLRSINFLYHIKFDGQYMALAIITFLISFVIFRELIAKNALRKGAFSIQIKNLALSWLLLIAILLFLGYATKSSEEFSRRVIMTWIVVTPIILLFSFSFARMVVFRYFAPEKTGRKAVVIGINQLSENLMQEFLRDAQLGIRIVGCFDDRATPRLNKNMGEMKLLGKLGQVSDFVKQNKIDIIYITLPMVQEKRIISLLDALSDTTASIYFVPDLFVFDLVNASIDEINGIPILAICESPFSGITGLFKRISDVVFASLIILLITPILLVIALIVKIDSKGPVIFKQRRYGLDGEEIIVYKFRSMTVLEDGGTVKQATRNDARLTRVGGFLRRTSLDELPQFFNVIQGRMSIVGPRPHAVAHNELYRGLIKGYMVRHKVRPGITGWAQVNGFRGETDSIEKMKSRIEYDLDYLRHWSLGLDLLIIFRTVLLLIKDRTAY